MSDTWSNLFVGKPLTIENITAAMAKMRAMADRPIAVTPDIVSCCLILDWLRMRLNDASRAVARAEKRIRKGILTGHYQKRRRQINHGIARLRLQKRAWAVATLPGLLTELERAQKASDTATATDSTVPYAFSEPTGPMFDNADDWPAYPNEAGK